ncbi:nucleophile aminohydrolase, partial [Ochromonadaceae sp. CCMP2298]
MEPGGSLLWLARLLVVVLFTVHLPSSSVLAYDTSTTQFDPTGRILQTEYAKRAVASRGGPVCAVKCSDGILLAVARHAQRNRLVLKSAEKLHFVDRHICIAASGLLSEASQLARIAQEEAERYRETYGTPIPVENLSSFLADVMHSLTTDGRQRPVGVGLLVAGWDKQLGYQVYTTDPQGSFAGWRAVSIGS